MASVDPHRVSLVTEAIAVVMRRLSALPTSSDVDTLRMRLQERLREARTWLQASNPSERWKWDFMYQDLPPVKGNVDPSSVPAIGLIPLREVK